MNTWADSWIQRQYYGVHEKILSWSNSGTYNQACRQWLIAKLVEHSLSVMKDRGSNLDMDIYSFGY